MKLLDTMHSLYLYKKAEGISLKLVKSRPFRKQPYYAADIDPPFEPKIIMPAPLNSDLECEYEECGCRINSMIWVSEKKRLVYFENPKCGSSTIKKVLKIKRLDKYDVAKEFLFLLYTGKTDRATIFSKNRKNIEEVYLFLKSVPQSGQEHLQYQPNSLETLITVSNPDNFCLFYGDKNSVFDIYKDFTFFSFVRNPWDRMVSNWAMFTQKKHRLKILQKMYHVKCNNLSFQHFTEMAESKKNHHWEPQSKFLPKNIDRLNYLGRIESFDYDLGRFLANHGYEYKKTKQNYTKRGSYHRYYDHRTRNIVENMYRKDIEAFGYTFNE